MQLLKQLNLNYVEKNTTTLTNTIVYFLLKR